MPASVERSDPVGFAVGDVQRGSGSKHTVRARERARPRIAIRSVAAHAGAAIRAQFEEFLVRLGYEYQLDENNDAYRRFLGS